jgi:hypothetical protein
MDNRKQTVQLLLVSSGRLCFSDFNIDTDGRVYLVRISFDGYGCCRMERDVERLSLNESLELVKRVDVNEVNCDVVRDILQRYFERMKHVIWEDALLVHGLLPHSNHQ